MRQRGRAVMLGRGHNVQAVGRRRGRRALVIGADRGSGIREQSVGISRAAVMGSSVPPITLHEPASCVIRVRGALSSDWSDRLGGMRIVVIRGGRNTITELMGRLADQAALHGVLAALYELGLPLLSVECTPAPRRQDHP
jgi:hypothetical protein